MAPRLLITASDAGSANFLAPVLKGLDEPFRLVAQDPAAQVFEREGVPHDKVERCGWDELAELGARALSGGCSALLTGTSWGPTLDKAATLEARRRKIPTAGIVDHWELYRERFSRIDDGRVTEADVYLSDSIWVPDDCAAEEAARTGLPAARMRVVGQPHLEAQAERLSSAPVQPNEDVVFVSQRIAVDFPKGSPLDPGFTEFDVLEMIVDALGPDGGRLILKLHPQEESDKYASFSRRGVSSVVVRQCDMRELLLNSRRIVGMFSMLLLEAGLVRSDVLSLFPKGDPARFIGNRLGATIPVTTAARLREALRAEASRGRRSAFGDAFVGSRERVANAIRELAS